MDVIADAAQVVKATLPEEQRVVAATPVVKPPKPPKPARGTAAATDDSTIPVDF